MAGKEPAWLQMVIAGQSGMGWEGRGERPEHIGVSRIWEFIFSAMGITVAFVITEASL